MKKKKICIVGDSWGRGEWGIDSDGNYTVLHKGLEEYLSKDFQVDNFSRGGESNKFAYDRLKESTKKYDLVLFFQTDPYRDYTKEQLIKSFSSYDGFMKKHKEALIRHYQRINSLKVPIFLIGGCTKVHEKDIIGYSNLKVFIPSVIEMLCPHLKQPEVWCGRWYNLMNMKTDFRIIDMVYENRQLQEKLASHDSCGAFYFQPDGGHANRVGHYEIYKKVINELLNEQRG